MIQVKLPNGAIGQFPDGMPNAEIEAVLQRQFGAPQPPAGPTIKVGGREIPVAQYRAMSDAQRQAIRSDVAQANPGAQTQSDILDPLVQGVTFGWGDELRGVVQGGIAAVQGGDFGSAYDQTVDESRNALQHERNVNPVGSFAAEVAGGLATGAGAGGQLVRGATTSARALTGAGIGVAQGAIYGAGAADQDKATGGIVGAATGGALGLAAPYVGQAARRLVSPLPASTAQSAAAQTLAREGVTLTAGQRTGSKMLQYAESELGGGAASDFMERQAEQFTAAALNRAGIAAQRATPEVIDTAFTALGNQFDRTAAITNTPFDNALQSNLVGIVSDYLDVAANPAPVVERLLNRLGHIAQQNGGRLSGRVYQNFRSELGRLTKSADGPTKQALRDMQEALDDAIERNLSGQTLATWRQIRRQYKNLLVIEKAATGAGANTAAGLLSPAQLRNAAINQNRRAFARGTNDFTEMANAGVQAMTPLPQSGTAPRLAVRGLPSMIGAAAGAPGGVLGAIGGAALGAAIPAVAGRALLSRPGRALLSNQLATGTGAGAVERLIRRGGLPAIQSGR